MMAIVAILFLQLVVFEQSHCKEICQREACKEEASKMLEAMDKTIEPCEDFYEFACRGWIRKNPIPQTEIGWDNMNMIDKTLSENIHNILDSPDKRGDGRPIKLARALYRSCMDLEAFENVGMESLYNALKKLGLPRTPPTDDEATKYDIAKIAGLAGRYYGINIFTELMVQQDPYNSTSYMVMMTEPEFVLKKLEVALREPIRLKFLMDPIKRYLKNMIRLTGAGNKSDRYTTEFLNFWTEMSKIMGQNPNYVRAPINMYQRVTDTFATKWNWTTFIENAFKETGTVINTKFDELTGDGKYFNNFKELLNKTPIATLVRAAYFHVFITIAAEATHIGNKLYKNVHKQVYASHTMTPKWMECTQLARKHFHLAITAAYIEKYFTPEQKKKAMEMWNDVRSSFDEMLNEIQWMDSSTKSQAHKKLRAMESHIAYPDWITNPRKLDKYYAEYNVYDGKLYESNALFNAIEIKKKLSNWKRKANRSEWSESPMVVNAFYTPTMNSVTIPVGILHIPFFGGGIDALNYGAIGAVLGHELTHGFDSTGREFDSNGSIRDWWSRDTLQHFLRKVQCMIKQYSGFMVPQLGIGSRVNGERTQGENIADNGGLKEAFRAFQKLKQRNKPQPALPGLVKYTDEQLFFLGYAQSWCANGNNEFMKRKLEGVHPPSRFRVMGTLQNNDEFAKAYNCRPGSRMNPRNKCVVW